VIDNMEDDMYNYIYKILILEDDENTINVINNSIFLLEEQTHSSITITADESIRTIIGKEKFDILLIDSMIRPIRKDKDGNISENIHFDGVNWRKTGVELIKWVREGKLVLNQATSTSPLVPIIVLSAITNVISDSVTNYKNVELISKPYRVSELIDTINHMLGR
jgi:CheY-like chemotaxis protein